MSEKELARRLKARVLTADRVLEELSKLGTSPCLLNDDNGHWALTFDGFQEVADGDDPQDLAISCFVSKEQWKDTIYDAVMHALEEDL